MKIILTQSVDTLGNAGDIINVKPGYCRNYLIPKGLAVIATPAKIQATKHAIEQKAIKEAKSKDSLQIIADKLNSIKLNFTLKAGEDEKLFGSVTTQMISDALNEKGYKVEKKYITLDKSIKSLGNYAAIVDFGDEITAKVKLKVNAE